MSLMPLGVFDRRCIPVDQSGLRLGGKPIRDYGLNLLLGGVEIEAASASTDFVNVPGLSGSVNRTLLDESGHAYTDRRTITMHVATTGREPEAVETKLMLGGLDGTDTTLEWGSLPGRYEGFLTVGTWSDVYGHGGIYRHSTCDLTMLANPDLIGDARSFDLSTTERGVWIRGNRPNRPVIEALPSSGTKRFYITVNGMQLVYNLTNADGARKLLVDCDGRESTYGGVPVFPTVDSDYPVLTPGTVLGQVSAGTATVTYHPHNRI